jgi:hypothetical protein
MWRNRIAFIFFPFKSKAKLGRAGFSCDLRHSVRSEELAEPAVNFRSSWVTIIVIFFVRKLLRFNAFQYETQSH